MTILLGITWAKNSTAAIYKNGEIIGCCSEERFSRVKNDERYPLKAILPCSLRIGSCMNSYPWICMEADE